MGLLAPNLSENIGWPAQSSWERVGKVENMDG
jgi:hypothetical protein